MNAIKSVQEAIQTLRAELKMNRPEELAVLLEVSSSTIVRWELGDRRPSRFHLFMLAKLARDRGVRAEIAEAFERETKAREKARSRRRKLAA